MKTFDEFKEWIISEGKNKDACKQGLEDAEKSANWAELLEVVKLHSRWLYETKIITTDTIQYAPDQELLDAGIYVKKENVIQRGGNCFYYSSTSKHYGFSTSEHYGSSTSDHYDSSTSKHYDSSTSDHYDSSTSKHYGSSTSKHYGFSTSEHYGSSTFGNVFELKDTSIIHEKSIVRERSTGKVYFKKNAFKIIEL